MEDNISVLKLVLSPVIASLVVSSWHSQVASSRHFSEEAMRRLMNNLFYTPGISAICRDAFRSCLACSLTKSFRARKRIGIRRSHSQGSNTVIGSHWSTDIGYMPVATSGETAVIIFIESITGFMVASAIKTVSSKCTAKAFQTFLGFYPAVQAVSSDAGAEFSKDFALLLRKNGIYHYTNTPGHSSNTMGMAENGIKLLKEGLRSVIYSTMNSNRRASWPSYIGLVLKKLNYVKLRGM